MELKEKGKIGWVDLLRIIACFAVVLSHCCDPFVAQFSTDKNAFLTGVSIGSLVRCSVPLFVMMSAVLLFPVRMNMADFYKKRIKRIIIPLIFWSIALPILYFVYLNYTTTTGNLQVVPENFTPEATLNKLYTFIFNFTYDTTPLWYLYMLVGLYLIIPILSAWMQQASQRDIKLFLFVWGISLLLPYIKMAAPLLAYNGNYGNMGLFGVCDWNDYGTFYYVSGFVGYLVLAYYLVKYPLTWSWKKMLSITIPMFLVGYLITLFGYLFTHKYYPGNYANLEIIWYFTGINVFMMTFPVFVIMQKIKVTSSAGMSRLASYTFGIYLCHFFFVQIAYDFLTTTFPLPAVISIILIAITSFLVSWLVVWVMDRFKITRLFVK